VINTNMDSDAGGNDTVAASPAEAVAMGMAHCAEMEMDTHGQGTTLGDLMAMPPAPTIDSTILDG
jgi:hypothetical protein